MYDISFVSYAYNYMSYIIENPIYGVIHKMQNFIWGI